eukprot:4039795-Ditylum_brightwellii.AAC.1
MTVSAAPMVHKAQLALVAPVAVSMKMFIDAANLWIPVSSYTASDGALFLDAGKVKMTMSTVSDTSIVQAKDQMALILSTEPHHQMLVRLQKPRQASTCVDLLSSAGEEFSLAVPPTTPQ